MKRISTLLTVFVFAFSLLVADVGFAKEKVNWKAFGKNLEMALKTPNTGLQVSAMQKVIKYAGKIKVDGAVLELVKLYRNHENVKVRQMALVTINTLNNDWAKSIAKRDYRFEKSEKIKKMMVAIMKSKKDKS